MNEAAIKPAFQDAPHEAQTVFRAVMEAMARPGRIGTLEAGFDAPDPLGAASAAILIALADFETPIWLDAALSSDRAATDFLRFHTGAKFAATPEEASFAVIAEPNRAPPLSAFAHGTPDYPDRSTTLVFQTASLSSEGWRLAGPGIQGEIAFRAAPLPEDFIQQLQDNRARFPLGVDLIFTAGDRIAALPRSTQILETR